MRVLCVAEKPSIAKSITEILSGGRWDTVSPYSCFLPFLLLNVEEETSTNQFISFLNRGMEETNIYAIMISYTTLLRRLGMEEVPTLPSRQSWDI